jgi:hypothetical protein
VGGFERFVYNAGVRTEKQTVTSGKGRGHMLERTKRIRKHAKEFFAREGLSADTQTRITLFLQGVKSINAAILARIEFQPFEWLPYKFLHNQYFKEIEMSTLLGKGTSWSANPFVYLDATNLNLTLWQGSGAARFMGGFLQIDQNFYEYLALSHAFMSDMRFLPLLPVSLSLDTPFLSALKEIEEENGRQIQTQIRLLKELPIELSHQDKEQIIDEQRIVIEALFDRLLSEISGYQDEEAAQA